jgi:exonuclease SbcC
MIPLHLTLSGFLSYQQLVEINFSTFDLACISGRNGAGKSSLLDAITWALFGQARKRDDSLINTHCDAAEVILTFTYEENVYRVQRTNPRRKTTSLEFHIQQLASGVQPAANPPNDSPIIWKPLTERTLRETQARIEETLRMDYETFINASFFLQGKADQFTQQRPGDRKRILGAILGLEVWETYRGRTAERRKAVETEIYALDGRLSEITTELEEEDSRKSRLEELQNLLERSCNARATQESVLENMRQGSAILAEQRKLVNNLAEHLEKTSHNLDELELRAEQRRQERDSYANVISRATEIETAYQGLLEKRADLEQWDQIATKFREQERRRREPLDEINATRARLEGEQGNLLAQEEKIKVRVKEAGELRSQLDTAQKSLEQIKSRLVQRTVIEADLHLARQKQADANAENPRLREEMEQLDERIKRLEVTEGAICPLCGGPLSPTERLNLIDELNKQGKEMGDKYRQNQGVMAESEQIVRELEAQLVTISKDEAKLQAQTRTVEQLFSRLDQIEQLATDWEESGGPRLLEITTSLEQDSYSLDARARLAEIDAELKEIGYDAAEHDATRQAVAESRSAESEFNTLEMARATLSPLERELTDLETQIEAQRQEVARKEIEFDETAAVLATAEAQAPDLDAAQHDLLDLQEEENRLRLEVGAAQQKVDVLDDLIRRHESLSSQREELARQVGLYKQLERAFSRDGVPALLIEQALPQIESKANETLERLSDGTMSVRFVTQAAYKDKRRQDLRETLDIQISDAAGARDYEMFSGGEAFRVNFAIRLALSEVLAQRAGAKLQTLVIDEGFGSQDTLGRQRLIEAINLVKDNFAKILVITHIEELKDAFSTRIEVEKTDRGSRIILN